jgi:hypothetical protein
MDLQKLIEEQGAALTKQLTAKAGFTMPEAQKFLPLIIAKVMEVVKSGKFDLKSLLGGADIGAIIGSLGLGDIAKKVGIAESKAKSGAEVVVPDLLQSLQKSGGLEGLLGGVTGGAADLLKKAGKMFGAN